MFLKLTILFFSVETIKNGHNLFHSVVCSLLKSIGPLHDPVTWYRTNYTGTQITQWDFQNKGKLGWTGRSSFALKVPLRNLRPSVIYSVPCDRIVQRAYKLLENLLPTLKVSIPIFFW